MIFGTPRFILLLITRIYQQVFILHLHQYPPKSFKYNKHFCFYSNFRFSQTLSGVWGIFDCYKRGSPLRKLLGAEEIGLFWLVDSYWGHLISHWLAILLIMVGFYTKPNAETAVCHWIMFWCSFLLTKIDVTYIVQDRWYLLADENRESLGAVNYVIMYQGLL